MDDPLDDGHNIDNEYVQAPDSSSGNIPEEMNMNVEQQPNAQTTSLSPNSTLRLSSPVQLSTTSTCSALPCTSSITSSSSQNVHLTTLSPSSSSPTFSLEPSSISCTLPSQSLSLDSTCTVTSELLPFNDVSSVIDNDLVTELPVERNQNDNEIIQEDIILQNGPESLKHHVEEPTNVVEIKVSDRLQDFIPNDSKEIVKKEADTQKDCLKVDRISPTIAQRDEKEDNRSDLRSQSSVQSSVSTEIINESSQGTLEDCSVHGDVEELSFNQSEIPTQQKSFAEHPTQPSNAFPSISENILPESSVSIQPEEVQPSSSLQGVLENIQEPFVSDTITSETVVLESSSPIKQDVEMSDILITSNVETTHVELEGMKLEENAVKAHAIEENAIEENAIEENAVEENAVEEIAVEEKTIEENSVEENSVEENSVEMKEIVQQPVQREIVDNIHSDIFQSIKFAICEDVHDIDEIKRVLLAGGAKFLHYLSDSASLLIADNVEHSTVSEAIDIFEKPVVTSQWVWLSLRAKTILPTTPFSLLKDHSFLSDICASSSQLTRTDRAKAWALITYYGGRFQSSLDENCTHLITNSISGRKYERTTVSGAKCKAVTLEWLQECCKHKVVCDEKQYNPRLLITYNSGKVPLKEDSLKKTKKSIDSQEDLDEEGLFSNKTTSSTMKAVKMSISTEACVRQKDAKIVPVKIAKPSIVELKSNDNAIVSPRTKAPLNVQTTHNVPTHSNSANSSPRNVSGTVSGTMSPRRYPPSSGQQQPNVQQHPQQNIHLQQNVQAKTQQVQSQQPSQELDPTKHFARKSQPQYSQQQQSQHMFPGQVNVQQNPNSMISQGNILQQMHPQQQQPPPSSQHQTMQQLPQQTHPSQQSLQQKQQQQHIQMSGRPQQISQIQQGSQQNPAQLLQQRNLQQQIQVQQQRGITMGANLQSQQQQMSPQTQQNPHQMQQIQPSPQQQNIQPQSIQQQNIQQQNVQPNSQQQQHFQPNGSVQQHQVYVSLSGQQDYQTGQQFVVQRPIISQQQNPQQMNTQQSLQMIQQQSQQQQQQQIYRYPNQQQALQAQQQQQQQQRFQQNIGMQPQQPIQQQQQQHNMAINSNVRMQQQQRFAVRPPMQQQIMQNAQQQQVTQTQVSPQSQQQMTMSQQNQGNYQIRPKLVILPNNDSENFASQTSQSQQPTQGGYPMNLIHIPANLTPEQRQQFIAQQRMQMQQQQLQHQQQQQQQAHSQVPHQQQQPITQQQQPMQIQQQSQQGPVNGGSFVQSTQMQIQVRQPAPVQQQQQVILQQQQQQRMMRPSLPQQQQQHYQMNQIRPQQIVRQMHPQQQMQYQQQQQQIQQQRQWQGQEFQGTPQQQQHQAQQMPQPQATQQAGISFHYNIQPQTQMRPQGQEGWVKNPVHPQQQRVVTGTNGPIPVQQPQQPPQQQQHSTQQHNQQVNVGVYQQQQQPKMVSSVQLIGPESGTKIKLEPAPPPPVATVVAGESRNLIVMQPQTQQVQQNHPTEQATLVQVQVQTSINTQPNTSSSQASQISSQNPNVVHEKTKTALANLLNNRLQNNNSSNGTIQQAPGTLTAPGTPTATVVQVSSGIPVNQTQGKVIQLPVQAFQVQQQPQQVPPLISQASVQPSQQQASLTPQNAQVVGQQQIVVPTPTQIQVQHLGQQPQQQPQQQPITLLSTNASVSVNANPSSGSFPHKQEHVSEHSGPIPIHQRNGYIPHGQMQPPPPYTGQNGVMLQQQSHPQHLQSPQHAQHSQQHPQQQLHQTAQQHPQQQLHQNPTQIPGQKVLHAQLIQQQHPQQLHSSSSQQSQPQLPQSSPFHPHMQPHSGFQHQVQLQQPQHLQQPPQGHQTVQISKTPRQQLVQIRYFGQETKIDSVPSRLCLFGSVFFFGPFYMEKESTSKMIPFWRKAIEKYGGKVVDDYGANIKIITHFLTDNMQSLLASTALKDGKRCVSVWWIEDVLSRQHLIPPWRFYHLPMMNNLSLKNQIITTTNFEKKNREKLRMLIIKAGGNYTPYISRQNTILIAATLRGPKYELALNYRLPIVNMKWLHDAMLGIAETLQLSNLGKRYLTFDSLSAESTNNTTNNATSKSLAGDIFGVDYGVVHNLMNSWKVSINYNDEELKKKHRDVLEEDKKEKIRIEEAKKAKAEEENKIKAELEKAAEEKKLTEILAIAIETVKETEKEPQIKEEVVDNTSKEMEEHTASTVNFKRSIDNVEIIVEVGEPSAKRVKIEIGDNIDNVSIPVEVQEITLRDSSEETIKDNEVSSLTEEPVKIFNDAYSQSTTTVDGAVSEFKVPLPPVVSVLVTGLSLQSSDKICEAVKKMGGKWTKSSDDCTHLIAPGLEGTIKFLCAYGKAKFVLKPNWIFDSANAGKFLPEEDYCLLSKGENEKYGIDFTEIERTPSLFKDIVFVLTPSISKNIQIVLTANGCFVALRDMPNRRQLEGLLKKNLKFVIVSCKTDLHLCRSLVTNQFRGLDISVISPECIYKSIYIQSIDFEKNNLLDNFRNGDNSNCNLSLSSSSSSSSSSPSTSYQNQSLLSRLQTNKLPSRPASATAILQRSFSTSSSNVSPINISGIHQTLNSVNTINSSALSQQVKPVNHQTISSFQTSQQPNIQTTITLNAANIVSSGPSQPSTSNVLSGTQTPTNKASSMIVAHSKPQAGNRLLVLPS